MMSIVTMMSIVMMMMKMLMMVLIVGIRELVVMLFLTKTLAAHKPNNDGDDVDSYDEREIPITTILYNARQKKRGRGTEEGLCFGEGIEWKRQGHAFYKLLISVFWMEKKTSQYKIP